MQSSNYWIMHSVQCFPLCSSGSSTITFSKCICQERCLTLSPPNCLCMCKQIEFHGFFFWNNIPNRSKRLAKPLGWMGEPSEGEQCHLLIPPFKYLLPSSTWPNASLETHICYALKHTHLIHSSTQNWIIDMALTIYIGWIPTISYFLAC